MRNLVLTRQWQGRIELEPGECMHSFCVDPDTGSVFVATSTGAVCRLAADLRVTAVPASCVSTVCASVRRWLISTVAVQVDWRVNLSGYEEVSPASSPAGDTRRDTLVII